MAKCAELTSHSTRHGRVCHVGSGKPGGLWASDGEGMNGQDGERNRMI